MSPRQCSVPPVLLAHRLTTARKTEGGCAYALASGSVLVCVAESVSCLQQDAADEFGAK